MTSVSTRFRPPISLAAIVLSLSAPFLSVLSRPALAQQQAGQQQAGQQQAGQQQAGQQQAGQQQAARSDWDIRLGAGALFRPDYEGSDDYEIAPLPMVSISYKDLVFLRNTTLGANAFTWQGPRPTDKLQIGPLLRYQLGRDEGDNNALRGMGDIDAGAELGAFVTYSTGPWSTGLTVFRDVSDAYEGA